MVRAWEMTAMNHYFSTSHTSCHLVYLFILLVSFIAGWAVNPLRSLVNRAETWLSEQREIIKADEPEDACAHVCVRCQELLWISLKLESCLLLYALWERNGGKCPSFQMNTRDHQVGAKLPWDTCEFYCFDIWRQQGKLTKFDLLQF